LFGRNTAAARHATTFAVLDLPFSAVRRFVGAGKSPPRSVEALISTAYSAVIEAAGASQSKR
jgi:hypothetical protein